MQYISYLLFLFSVYLFALVPFRVMYVLSDGLAFLLRVVVKYRLKVVKGNIDRVFTDYSEQQKDKIIRDFYRHLADITLETIKGFSMSPGSVVERHHLLNREVLDEYYDRGISVIGVTGHLGNWEWGSLSGGLQMKFPLVGFYKPLSNKYMDKYILRSRAKFNTELASITKTYFTFEKAKDTPTAYIMVADQNPGRRSRAIWVDFLGIDTAFLHGPEKYANLYGHAVVYVDIARVKRGYYALALTKIAGPGEMPEPGRITAVYAGMLEEKIRQRPESWLWSHKRWKYSREEARQDQASA